jgi:hypothetical protein
VLVANRPMLLYTAVIDRYLATLSYSNQLMRRVFIKSYLLYNQKVAFVALYPATTELFVCIIIASSLVASKRAVHSSEYYGVGFTGLQPYCCPKGRKQSSQVHSQLLK